MNALPSSQSESELRAQIRQLRRELEQTAQSLVATKMAGDAEEAIHLLLRRSTLAWRLFEGQSTLTHTFRPAAHGHP